MSAPPPPMPPPGEHSPDPPSTLAILEGSPHGILIASTRAGGTTLYANQRLERMFNTPVPKEPGGLVAASQALFDRNGEEMPFEQSPLGIALRLRRPARAEVQYLVPGLPTLRLDITATPLECAHYDEPLAVAYLHDISHQQHAADALDEANRRLAQQLEDQTWVHSLTERLADHGGVEETLRQVLAEGALLLQADMGAARLYNEDLRRMETRAVHGFPEEREGAHKLLDSVGIGEDLVDVAVRAGGWLVFEDVTTDPSATTALRELGHLVGFRAVYVLALHNACGRKLGVVAWAFRAPGRPTARQRQLASTYCRFAGQVVENNRLYERERRIASTLQQSMLAQQLPEVAGVRVAACSLPGARGMQAGGDWYDVISLPEGKAGLALGDVMGKGLGAATAMGQLRTALRSYALVQGEDPVAVLSNLNALTADMALTDLATVLYLTVDPVRRLARVASAGHCPPLLVDGSGASFVGAGQGVPLGVLDDWQAEESSFELPEGSLLVLYTDGLVERRGEELGVGLERLRQAALSAPEELDELCAHLVERCAEDGAEGAEESANPDDVAILAVRVG
ncbi:SpoIIE family protein phosphatase [Streptomyces sp. SID8379]|uniref:PP2C family protein-serine/threonine phosphatase n=1 Tax=unclassified Streptomyces TaxID=2593676 RepID=UPI00039A775F|nr:MULTISPECIES: PP2C family protein-serine/threonine phosphatase [unclassified Streptomyces]MYW66075.1 SpoIIE family protein phosphatase [Streptomyces sp. SID8379]